MEPASPSTCVSVSFSLFVSHEQINKIFLKNFKKENTRRSWTPNLQIPKIYCNMALRLMEGDISLLVICLHNVETYWISQKVSEGDKSFELEYSHHPFRWAHVTKWINCYLFFFLRICLFMRDTRRERSRDTAEGEAGSSWRTQCKTRSQDPKITTWAKGRCSTTEPPRCPTNCNLTHVLLSFQ